MDEHLNWNVLVSPAISKVWETRNSRITELRQCSIHRSYFPKEADITTIQLHDFCDASEVAFAGLVYLRGIYYLKGTTHTSLVVAKTKLAPIKRITIPRLELCGL